MLPSPALHIPLSPSSRGSPLARRASERPGTAEPALAVPCAAHPLRVRARRLSAASQIAPHQHPWAQIAFSATGILQVTAGHHSYIVPPSRAVWIPPGMSHAVGVVADAELRALYLHMPAGQLAPASLLGGNEHSKADQIGKASKTSDSADWARCRVLEVSALLRELVEQLAALPNVPSALARERCLAALIQDELRLARPLPLGVELPLDKRLRSLCLAVLDNPARHGSLAGWAGEAGASVRTVARLFRQELDTTFAEWRQQVMLAKALSMAATRRPMAHIAAELGYASPSAFSAMVRRSVGMPPSRFFASA